MNSTSSRAATAPDVEDARPTPNTVAQQRPGRPEPHATPKPLPGPEEVVVRVHAASVNARDWHIMRGEPRLARLLDRSAFAAGRPLVPTPGTDLAGAVEAVGESVTTWRPGDAVFGEGIGTFAEHARAPANQVAAIGRGGEVARTLMRSPGRPKMLKIEPKICNRLPDL